VQSTCEGAIAVSSAPASQAEKTKQPRPPTDRPGLLVEAACTDCNGPDVVGHDTLPPLTSATEHHLKGGDDAS
jgi:hypothetical protein